ncbi:YibE/F family protein, partial [Staphylococcus hominis]|uniref:YibE/F family protein n=1 Tax=Staphylococcus hominis TaxID=1290 RepID=UPI0021B64E5E
MVRLVLVSGWEKGSWVRIVGSLCGRFLCVGISELLIEFRGGNGMKYERMSFLRVGGKDVFMCCVVIGRLGGVMDVGI